MRTILVSIFLVAILAAIILVPGAGVQGSGSFSDLTVIDTIIITAPNESFALEPGYVYTIEASGSKGSYGFEGLLPSADGGNGTNVLVWLDLRADTNPLVLYGGTTGGGAGGIANSSNGGNGGSSTYVFFYDNSTLLMVAGGGGGGGAGTGNGGLGGNAGGGGSGTSHPTQPYIVYNGSNGLNGDNKGGGGGSTINGVAGTIGNKDSDPTNGSVISISSTTVSGGIGGRGGGSQSNGGGGGGGGYAGGGGGSNGSHIGAGGGGGSSLIYVGDNFSQSAYSFTANNDTTTKITIIQYGSPTISGTVKFTEEYGGGPISNAAVKYCVNDDFANYTYAYTDSDGNYLITVYGAKITFLDVEVDSLVCETPVLPVSYTMNTYHTGVDFEMSFPPNSFGVIGNVTRDSDGVALSGVEIKVMYGNGTFDSVFTESDGSYIITVLKDSAVMILDIVKSGYAYVIGPLPSFYSSAAYDVDFTMDFAYTLTYDVNGGIMGSGPGSVSGLLAQKGYGLTTTPKPTHADEDGDAIVFIGWSAGADSKIYKGTDAAPTNIITKTDISDDTSVYAVWGYDLNGDGNPDVFGPVYTLTYDVNGGTTGSGPASVLNVPIQKNYVLATTPKPTHEDEDGDAIIFIGWSANPDSVIYKGTDEAPTNIIKETNILGHTAVYAVWGYDLDGDGNPDVLGPVYTLTYDVNGGIAGSGPAPVSDLPVQKDYDLATTPKPTHEDEDGDAILFIGWSADLDSKIYKGTDVAPTNIITKTGIMGDTTVYAVWGYDLDGDGEPDVIGPVYTLTYDVNGGITGSGPALVSDLPVQKDYELATTPKPAHADEDGDAIVFVGWSADADSKIYKGTDAAPTHIITKTGIMGDTIVYAVWGYDLDGDGEPDIIGPVYTLTYDVNGGITGSGPATVSDLPVQRDYALATTPVPTHADDGEDFIIFIGWSASADSQIYKGTDEAPTNIIKTVDIMGHTTVYAVWGFDLDGDGEPDVLGPTYTLTYDVNGGITGSGPASVLDLPVQRNYTLATTPKPTHANDGDDPIVFIGWSAAQDSKIYKGTDAAPTNIITTADILGNTTVYAVWGYDLDGDGEPDVIGPVYTLTYDVNGGMTGSGPATVSDLPVQKDYTLDAATKPTHADDGYGPIVFIGWSASADSTIYKGTDAAPINLITTADIMGNTTVYAVWGYDLDGDGEPDVLGPVYMLTYDVNGGTTGSGPAVVSDLPVQKDYVLDTTTKPTHADDGYGPIIFIGWSASADSTIYKGTDAAPTNLITTTDIMGNTTVYAVWGYDLDGDGEPDVLGPVYTLTYDVNGGMTGSGPATVSDLPVQKDYVLDTTTKPTHADKDGDAIVFVGWSAIPDSKIYEGIDTAPTNIITTADIMGNTTVYAVWGYDLDGDGIPDVLGGTYSLTYDVNGGITGSGPAIVSDLPAQKDYTLATTPKPTHADDGYGPIVFIGWSASADSTIYKGTDAAPTNLITTTDILDNTTVYVVWGYDLDGDGEPDVLGPVYTLTYDVNGGTTGSGPATVSDLPVQKDYVLDTVTKPTHADDGYGPIVFIGWSASADSTIYKGTDAAPTNLITTADIMGNTTVYAVWGYDLDGDGEPDVIGPVYTLTYDVNGGMTGSGPATVSDLLVQKDYTLDTVTKPTHADDGYGPIVFIGWSASADSTIYKGTDAAPTNLITTADIMGNTTVYAVWGYDLDGDGEPDVLGPVYTLTYNVNGGTFGSGPVVVSDLPVQKDYVLDTTTKPTHADDGYGPIIFIGWSASADSTIYKGTDTAPTNLITTTDIMGNTTVYAVWGYDLDGDGEPDVLGPVYTLTYNVNGGMTGSGPATVSDLPVQKDYVLDTTTKPTHADDGYGPIVFIGWSASADSTIYKGTDTAPTNLITTTDIMGNTTVYAVWGYDLDGDGEPDVLGPVYTLTYNVNGGTFGSGPAIVSDMPVQKDFVLDTTTKPTHADDGYGPIVFIGWSASADSTIYKGTDAAPTNLITTVDIMGNTTVYAVWGYDLDGDGEPDVIGPTYTLTYDVNGGTFGSGPASVSDLPVQRDYALAATPKPTHEDEDGDAIVFIGWSAVADSTIYKGTDEAPTHIITETDIMGDTIVYAVWGYDLDGDGEPDVIGPTYTLTYDVNGGTAGSGPALVSDLPVQRDYELATTPKPTHENQNGIAIVFIGWSADLDSTIYKKTDSVPTHLITETDIMGDTVVYAVWGYDRDDNVSSQRPGFNKATIIDPTDGGLRPSQSESSLQQELPSRSYEEQYSTVLVILLFPGAMAVFFAILLFWIGRKEEDE